MASLAWSKNWKKAPRDGRPVRLKDKAGNEHSLYWSAHYSVFGLGGCWTDGFCTMGEGVDFTHWAPDEIVEHGAMVLNNILNGDQRFFDDLSDSERKTLRLAAWQVQQIALGNV